MPPKTNFDINWAELHLCSTNDATCVASAASTGDWKYIGDDCGTVTPEEIDLGGTWPKTQDSTNPYTYEHCVPTEFNYTLNSIPFKYKLKHR